MKTLLGVVAAVAVVAAAGSAAAQVTTMYSTDFDTATTYAGVTAVMGGTGGLVDLGATSYGGATENIWHNATNPPTATTWTLSNLPTHDQIIVDFHALFLDSWDSTNGSPSPDFYNVFLDGALAAQMTSANASGNVNDFDGGTQTFFGNIPNFNGGWSDRVVDMSASTLTIAHTASSFVLSISAGGNGWQGSTDESWGIDNLNISANLVQAGPGPIPEPAAWAMMIMGFGAAGAMIRRRRISAAVLTA